MTRTSVDRTKRALEHRPEVEQLSIDGDTATRDAIFRAMIDGDRRDAFEVFVAEELDVEIESTKWVVFGEEVVLR